ncbi:hypothetical protein GOP47_0002881 [Adiantum capillus-veneris]|uniref:Uncharacterized protein n=1 Tax=Adiantum capillus-veneris TaxID=13818 RepID=A0A9D4ZPJ9_ADICA|nr:hypothetical protein GOP47_0002881 [Adiantum capillus-veneris]
MACPCSRPGNISSFPLPRTTSVGGACFLPCQNQHVWTGQQTARPSSSLSATLSQCRVATASHSSLSAEEWDFPPLEGRVRMKWALHASQEDFEVEGMADFDDEEKEEEDEEDLQDFETDYDVGGKFGDHDRHHEGDTFISTRGEAAESVVDYKINEDEFHKLSLQTCDFFIRKVPDVDNDVFDFNEMYVTDPDTDVYAIPRADEKLPKRPVRFTVQKHEHFCTHELPVDSLRAPMVKNELQVMKIFLMKHFKNRRASDPNFVLDFDQIYVIDSKARSISRAKVTLDLPNIVDRDRRSELLVVHDDGATFTVIEEWKRKTPDQIVLERQFHKTKKDLDNYLKSFRDYPISNCLYSASNNEGARDAPIASAVQIEEDISANSRRPNSSVSFSAHMELQHSRC